MFDVHLHTSVSDETKRTTALLGFMFHLLLVSHPASITNGAVAWFTVQGGGGGAKNQL